MLKFSLCLDPVFEKYDLYDRVRIAADQGFQGVEFWDPATFDLEMMRRVCDENHVAVANMNCFDAWEMNMCELTDKVLANMRKSLEAGGILGAKNILVLSGFGRYGHAPCQKLIMLENLRHIAGLAKEYGIRVNLEPLNSIVEHKGIELTSSSDGFEIVKCVNSESIGMVYDIYHMQIMEGNVISNMTRNIGLIGHVHSAGCPGRHEHFLGENDYPNILRAIDRAGYNGFVGLEYFPSYDSEKSTRDVLRYLQTYQNVLEFSSDAD